MNLDNCHMLCYASECPHPKQCSTDECDCPTTDFCDSGEGCMLRQGPTIGRTTEGAE